MKTPAALKGTSPKSVMKIFHNHPTVRFRIWGRQEGADEIEKELDGALPYGDDMVRAERLRASMLKSATCPASIAMRD